MGRVGRPSGGGRHVARDEYMLELGTRLRTVRGDRTQVSVCRAVGLSQAALSLYENGQRSASLYTLRALARYYDVDVVTLLPEWTP